MSQIVPIRESAVPSWLALRGALEDAAYLVPCRSAPEIWSGDSMDPETVEYAERRCQLCPALTACATYADAAKERGAVWGGLYRPTKSAVRQEIST